MLRHVFPYTIIINLVEREKLLLIKCGQIEYFRNIYMTQLIQKICSNCRWGKSGDAMVPCKLAVPGRPTHLDNSRARGLLFLW